MKDKAEREKYGPQSNERLSMISEIEWYCKELNMGYPDGFPDGMSDVEMKKWIETWDEFDPCPDV